MAGTRRFTKLCSSASIACCSAVCSSFAEARRLSPSAFSQDTGTKRAKAPPSQSNTTASTQKAQQHTQRQQQQIHKGVMAADVDAVRRLGIAELHG